MKKSKTKQNKQKKGLKEKELENSLKRIAADLENYKKRAEKEKQSIAVYTAAKTIKAFLPVLDAVEQAASSTNKNSREGKGIHLIKKQFQKTIERLGVKEIKCIGKEYNSSLHECLLTEHNKKKKDMEITQVIQKGFTFNEKTLRPARVKVNKL